MLKSNCGTILLIFHLLFTTTITIGPSPWKIYSKLSKPTITESKPLYIANDTVLATSTIDTKIFLLFLWTSLKTSCPGGKPEIGKLLENTKVFISNRNSNIDCFPLYSNTSTILNALFSEKGQRNVINVNVERGRAKKVRLVLNLQSVLGPAIFAEETVTLLKCRVIASTSKACPQKLAHPARINAPNVKRYTTLRLRRMRFAVKVVMSGIMPLALELKLLTFLF